MGPFRCLDLHTHDHHSVQVLCDSSCGEGFRVFNENIIYCWDINGTNRRVFICSFIPSLEPWSRETQVLFTTVGHHCDIIVYFADYISVLAVLDESASKTMMRETKSRTSFKELPLWSGVNNWTRELMRFHLTLVTRIISRLSKLDSACDDCFCRCFLTVELRLLMHFLLPSYCQKAK